MLLVKEEETVQDMVDQLVEMERNHGIEIDIGKLEIIRILSREKLQ